MKAFRSKFPGAIYLYCLAHARARVMDKARKCGLNMRERNIVWRMVQLVLKKKKSRNFDCGVRHLEEYYANHPNQKQRTFAPYLAEVLGELNEHCR